MGSQQPALEQLAIRCTPGITTWAGSLWAHAPLPETLRALMREHPITYRALAARTQLIDRHGNGLSYSHIANLASGRDTPSRHALELLARAFELPASYFAEYRLAELRRQLPARVLASSCRPTSTASC